MPQARTKKTTAPAPQTPLPDPPGGDGAAPALTFGVPRATAPKKAPRNAPLDHPSLYFNRELSWLDFNWRVLYQAMDERNPLLERVRFLAIATNNLDEFFRKRVGGLKRQQAAGVRALSPDGRTPAEQLALIRTAALDMYETIGAVWQETLRPALNRHGVRILEYDDLTARQKKQLHEQFLEEIFPILTPLAVDPGHPFPFISNLSLSLAVAMRHPTRGTEHFARLKVPIRRGRWLEVAPQTYVAVEQVVKEHVGELFRGMEILSAHAFRITRNADVTRNEEEADDLLSMISDEVRERRFAPVVRLEVEETMPETIRTILKRELQLKPDDVYTTSAPLDLADCHFFANLELSDLQYIPWEPVVPTRLRHEGETEENANLFSIIRGGDFLVHHPYESFRATVQRFIEEAADDPNVIAIKQTLYRTNKNSPIVAALLRAAERGKQVAVLIELKARFDEENNIEWAQVLEKAGVHVTYGLVGLKTHTKVTLVIREEDGKLCPYVHIGTGNYNPKTARLYTDLGLFSSHPKLGKDVVHLFHYLTGYAPEQRYEKLIVAPRDMMRVFVHKIHREIEHQKKTGNGRIIAKMNGLDDPDVIQELYRASKAGVQIDLIVRGHTRLRPGLPGISENIRLISIIGRFLEHSRIYYFHNGGDPELLIGSADWQRRNLEERIEAVVPITDEELKQRLIRILQFQLSDNRLAWDLNADGRYILRRPADGEEERSTHDLFMQRALARTAEEDPPWDIVPVGGEEGG